MIIYLHFYLIIYIQDQSNQVFIPGDQNSSNNVDNENNSLNPDNSIVMEV